MTRRISIQVEERLNLINRLKEKYGNTIPDILRYQEEREREIERLQDADAYRERASGKSWRRNGEQVEALCGRLSRDPGRRREQRAFRASDRGPAPGSEFQSGGL